MDANLSSSAYDTTRLGLIIQESEKIFYHNQKNWKKTIYEISSMLDEHILAIEPTLENYEFNQPIKYVAIDGTRDIIENSSHARIFAGAFAVSGNFETKVDITNIERGCAFSVVSLPYKILTSGNDYITESAGTITNLVMLLAEIFVATQYAQKDIDIILLDRPLCGSLAHTRVRVPDNSILINFGAEKIDESTEMNKLYKIFEFFCKRLFLESHPEPLKINDRYISSEELMYLCRIGFENLFNICSEKNIDLIGLTKTTNDCSFLRLLITLNSLNDGDTRKIRKILSQIDDCKMLASWIAPFQKLVCSREYDTALMTIMVDETKKVIELGGGGIAPRKRIVRSYMSFGIIGRGGFVFAVERLVLPQENAPLLHLPDNTDIFLFPKQENEKQSFVFNLLKGMCTGAFPEALYYPLPLALSHRFAKSNFDYIRPRLKATSKIFGKEYGYNDIKRGFT